MAENTSHSHQAPPTSETVTAEPHPEETASDPDEDDLDDLDGEGLCLQSHFPQLKLNRHAR